MKPVRVQESERFSAKLSKPRQLAFNQEDRRISFADDEARTLENVNAERDYLTGRAGIVLQGHTETATTPANTEKVPITGADDKIVDAITFKGFYFVALSSGKIYYTSASSDTKANWQALQWQLEVVWDISLPLSEGGTFQIANQNTLYLFAKPYSLAIDVISNSTIKTRLCGMPKISCALVAPTGGVWQGSEIDQNFNTLPHYIEEEPSTALVTPSRFYRVYGIELIEAARDSNGNFVLDTTEYSTYAGSPKVKGLPIRLRSSGIQRYAQKMVTLAAGAFANDGGNNFALDADFGFSYDGNQRKDLMRANLGTQIVPIIDFDSLGLTYGDLLAGSDNNPSGNPLPYANFHGWTHIILWRSKILRTHKELQDYDTSPVEIEADGTESEMYMVAAWEYNLNSFFVRQSTGTAKTWLTPNAPQGAFVVVNEAEIWNKKAYSSPVPDDLLFAQFDEMDLDPIKGNFTSTLAASRIWTARQQTPNDVILNFGYSLSEYNGVYREQTQALQFRECNQGKNGGITNITEWNGDLIVLKELEVGYIRGASIEQPYQKLQDGIGVPIGWTIETIPELGICAITSDRGRFGIFQGSRWTYDFGGRNVSRSLGSIKTEPAFLYLNGRLHIAISEDQGSTLTIYRMSIEERSGWQKSHRINAGTNLRFNAPKMSWAVYDGTQVPAVFWGGCPPILLDTEAPSTQRKITELQILGNENLFAHDQNPVTGLMSPVKCKFDTSFFNSQEGRDLLEYRYLSLVAGMAGPAEVKIFVNDLLWSGTLDPSVQGGLNIPYSVDYPREWLYYPSRSAGELKAIGQNFHFEIETYSPFFLRSLDLYCFIQQDPQLIDFDPAAVNATGGGSTPPQALAQARALEHWITRPNMAQQQGQGAPVRLFRPFIQAGSPYGIRGNP